MSDRDILESSSSGIVLVNMKSMTLKKKKYIVVLEKKDADNNEHLYYKTEKAREVLTVALRSPMRRIYDNGEGYDFVSMITAKSRNALIPKTVSIMRGGGFYTNLLGSSAVEGPKELLIDLLLYSPFTCMYEICKATYDMDNEECFIDIVLFRKFVYQYGNPGIDLHFIRNSGTFGKLSERSIMREYGYTVSKKEGYSADYRQQLLSELVDLNILSVKQIVEQLEFQINTKKDRYPEACMKYKEDEDYIMSYKANPERFMIAPS